MSPRFRNVLAATALALAVVPAAAQAAATDLKVMVRNVYLGADLIPLATQTDRAAFEQAPGVESVEDQREVVDKLFTFLGVLSVGALALAHERGCEADLAADIDAQLGAGVMPDLAELRARFAPRSGALPEVTVALTPLSAYDALTAAAPVEEASA